MAEEAQHSGIELAYLDAGGGLGIADQAEAPSLTAWISAVADPIHASQHALVVEPGRSLVAESGALLTQVVYTKKQGAKAFAIVDAGMAELIRPTLYDAHHPILTLNETPISAEIDIVGPICETGDWLARSRPMPELHAGDLLAVMQAGAYGFAMSSNYNGRLRSAEVLVDGESWSVIRPRQTFADLL